VSHVFAICGRELRSMFTTPDAYVLIGVYMFFAGFVFFFSLGSFILAIQQIQALGATQYLEEWNLQDKVVADSLSTFSILLGIVVPLLAMRGFAAERATGSIELLLTSPITSAEIVIGKFLAIAILLAVVTALTSLFVALLFLYGNPEVWQTLSGLQILFLYALAIAAISSFVSSLTRSQIVAGILGIVISILLLFLPVAGYFSQSETLRNLLIWLGPNTHLEPALRGDVRSEDLAYFAIVVVAFLSLARAAVDSLRWS